MNQTLKNGLIFAAKNAVNAMLTAVAPIIATPQAYNLTTKAGLEHVAVLVGGAVVSRELMVWVPKLMAWSTSSIIIVNLLFPILFFLAATLAVR